MAKPKSESKWMEYQEAPAYLLDPVAKVSYRYDAVGNRISMTTDKSTIAYSYDKANRLLSDGTSEYYYDRSGSLTARVTGEDETLYSYNAAGKLVEVTKPDETAVSYQYDALGRKVTRTETAWTAKGKPGATPPGRTEEKGWGNNETNLKQETGKPQEKSTGKAADPCAEEEASAAAPGNGKGKALGLTKHQQLKLAESTTRYVYDGLGLNLLKEYTANGAPNICRTPLGGLSID